MLQNWHGLGVRGNLSVGNWRFSGANEPCRRPCRRGHGGFEPPVVAIEARFTLRPLAFQGGTRAPSIRLARAAAGTSADITLDRAGMDGYLERDRRGGRVVEGARLLSEYTG